jgi:hypothetical protein
MEDLYRTLCKTINFMLTLTMCNPIHVILIKGSPRVRPVNVGCFLLHDTRSYLCFLLEARVDLYIRICKCFRGVMTTNILLTCAIDMKIKIPSQASPTLR